ncbi:hypothetical protein H8959_016742 [Pygathrix nigripes]
MHSLSQLAFTVNLPFCGPNIVDSYYCDLTLVIKLACTDTYIPEVLMLLDSGLMGATSFFLLLISYTVILITVQRHSSSGMAKARSTLTAHITVVTLFFGPCIFIYAWPFSNLPVDNILSVFSTVFTPILNPLIYTLRNKEVKSAIHKLKTHHDSEWEQAILRKHHLRAPLALGDLPQMFFTGQDVEELPLSLIWVEEFLLLYYSGCGENEMTGGSSSS